jgi:hypothetical protein
MNHGMGKNQDEGRHGLIEIYQHFPAGADENDKKFQLGLLVSQLRIKPSTFLIQVQSITANQPTWC